MFDAAAPNYTTYSDYETASQQYEETFSSTGHADKMKALEDAIDKKTEALKKVILECFQPYIRLLMSIQIQFNHTECIQLTNEITNKLFEMVKEYNKEKACIMCGPHDEYSLNDSLMRHHEKFKRQFDEIDKLYYTVKSKLDAVADPYSRCATPACQQTH